MDMEFPSPERSSCIRAAVMAEYECRPSRRAEALAEQLQDFLNNKQVGTEPRSVPETEETGNATSLARRLGAFALKELEAFKWFSKECVRISPAGAVGFLYKEISDASRSGKSGR